MKKDQTGFGVVEVLVVFLILGLMATIGWLFYEKQTNQPEDKQASVKTHQAKKQEEAKPRVLERDTFGNDGEYGTFQAEGYPTVVKVNEAFCSENCEEYDYVFFTITRIENTNLPVYLKKLSGNSFVRDDALGIGCLTNDTIRYFNSSDEKGTPEYTIDKNDTAAIMAATAENPVVLDIERLVYSYGKDAPTCYSHFTTFSVLR